MDLHTFRESRNIPGRYEIGINSDRMDTELLCRLEPFCLFIIRVTNTWSEQH